MNQKGTFYNMTTLKKTFKLLAISTLFSVPSIHANGHNHQLASMQNAPIVQQRAPQLNPQQLLETSLAKVLYFLSQPLPNDMDAVTDFVVTEVAPNFDFQYMSRWVAGRYYAQMPVHQQQAFTANFTRTFITNMVKKLVNYGNTMPRTSAFRSKQLRENEAVVSVNIFYGRNQKVDVDFRYIRTPNGWRAVDVKANGISALMYYRNHFASQLRASSY